MKPATLEDAPVGAATSSPELIPHEWSEGACKNPETVVIDFGAKSPDSAATIFLGADAEGRWHYGYDVTPKKAPRATRDVTEADSHATRQDALRAALAAVGVAFNKAKDKKGALAISGYYEAHFSAQPLTLESSPANNADTTPTLPPLPKGRFAELRVSTIFPSPANARKVFDPVQEQELADSIKVHGLLQPIAVRRLLADELDLLPGMDAKTVEQFELLMGERRWRAHQRLGIETIEAKVYEGVTRARGKAAALVENLQRVNLNPIEEAEGYRDLMETESLTQEQCAERCGRSRPVVANALRVLALPSEVVDLIRAKKLTIAHGVAFARFKPKDEKAEKLTPSWRALVRALADEAVAGGIAASAFEGKGLPCIGVLVRSGLVVSCNVHDVDGEWPAAVKGHPAYFGENEWTKYCTEPAHWQGLVNQFEGERKRQAAAQAEKDRKAADKAAKNPTKIKSLEDLPRNSYTVVEDQTSLALMPDDSTASIATAGGGKVTICTQVDLAKAIDAAVAAAKAVDRKAKLPKIFGEALQTVADTKKLGARELQLLFYLASAQNKMCEPSFRERAAKYRGVKIPAKAFDSSFDGELVFDSTGFAALSEVEPVKLYKVLITDWLQMIEDDAVDISYNMSPDGDAGFLLRWITQRDDLGLLEETKSGLKQLLKQVEASADYQAAIAANDPAAVKAGKGKAAK